MGFMSLYHLGVGWGESLLQRRDAHPECSGNHVLGRDPQPFQLQPFQLIPKSQGALWVPVYVNKGIVE